MITPLAQQQTDLTGILLWGAVLILISVIAFAIMVFAKKRLLHNETTAPFTWSHEQLLEMRDSGEITIQQYEKLRSRWFGDIRKTSQVPETSINLNSTETLTPAPEAISDDDSGPKEESQGDIG